MRNPEDACCEGSAESRAELEKAIRFFFQEDYFWGTECMILWWRKAVDDLEFCQGDRVTALADKLEWKLNSHREIDGYYDLMLAGFLENEASFRSYLSNVLN